MPKLLSMNNYHYRRGGSDVVYLEHNALFQSLGWDTADFAMRHPQNLPSKWSEYFVSELEFGKDYSVVEKLKMASKVIYSFEAKSKMKRLIGDFGPDIAHAHCIYHHLSPAIFDELKKNGVPIVMTIHDLKVACPAYKMLNSTGICERCKPGGFLPLIKNKCIHGSLLTSSLVYVESTVHRALDIYKKNLDKIIVPSLFFKNKLEEWGWNPSVIEYIPNYVRVDSHVPEFKAGKYFLYFGRLAPEKGVATLIRAAINSNVTLKIVGTGPIETELKELAEGHSNVEFLGFKLGDELWDLVRGSRAVVLPSEWYENAPMSVLESCALGKIVVGADIGGIPELIKDGETGFVFDSGDCEHLEALLTSIANSPSAEIERMGRLAREYVDVSYNQKNYVEKMLNLYHELTGIHYSNGELDVSSN